MANNKKVISQDELFNLTYDKLSSSGINISKSMLELAVRAYNEVKSDQLINGFSYEENRIGIISPSWRKVSKAFAPRDPFTPKITVQMEPALKNYLQEQLRTSPEFREAVGAQEL